MCKLRINMTDLDAMIRFYIAIFFMVLSVSSGVYLLLFVSIILIFTAIKRRCFIYATFGLNQKLRAELYYKNQYLENNTDIFIFIDEDDEVLYSNRVEVNIYLKDIFNQIESNIFEITIDDQLYLIRYRSLLLNQIRLIELKK